CGSRTGRAGRRPAGAATGLAGMTVAGSRPSAAT
ncbi:helix-turn-helix transcriptional regulator, partial [Streptomyces cavourensis]